MENKPVDLITVILQKFDALGEDVNTLVARFTQLSAEIANIVKMLGRLEDAIEKLEARDDAQQRAIDDLRLDAHRTDAALTAVSGNVQQALALAQRHESLTQASLTERAQLRKTVNMHTTKLDVIEKSLDVHINQWEPWLKGIKWALLIIGGVIVTALAVWLLQNMAYSVVTP